MSTIYESCPKLVSCMLSVIKCILKSQDDTSETLGLESWKAEDWQRMDSFMFTLLQQEFRLIARGPTKPKPLLFGQYRKCLLASNFM